MTRPLDGAVALVTGASQGIGQGIAIELGRQGATVWLTARTAAGLEQTAGQIAELGGVAVARPCDHADDAQVVAVFDALRREAGRLDLVVNVASPDFTSMVGQPFWTLPFQAITDSLAVGPRANFVTSALAAPIMIEQGGGLIVNISSHGCEDYILSAPYGAAKAAIEKITHDTALELREHNVAVIGLWPGLVLTDRILSFATEGPSGSRQLFGLDLDICESPRFSGRAVVALFTDPDRMARTGRSSFASRLAREYGFTDVAGHLPPEVRLLVDLLGDGNVPEYWQMVERFGRGFAEPSPA
ncbi:SDR family NAD(P)-dependent oxidoreductase [Mycobacterium paraense]|uniref:SDR family NAD(P)-dependent oxidoreductase n=1 Tax=Mycobacterium paraense TaxID=767916 RepID=UPI000A154F7E|nr:SDR family NAD(P)-dependent oxidoreductase [Mycobacterium paraense]MCV7443701.1 SDR family NAD(P)-dependent oxidoreductase [Mycobacterium paraense]